MKHLVLKIHCRGDVEFPTTKKRNELSERFQKTNLFEFVGKSRIDGCNMYKLKDGVIRLGKIQKIKKISPTIMDKLQLLLDETEKDVESITILNEE